MFGLLEERTGREEEKINRIDKGQFCLEDKP